MITQYAGVVYANLRVRKVRTALTILGIFIGIAAVVTLVSLGQGLQTAIMEQFAKVGTDKLFVQPKGSFTGIGVGDAANLTQEDIDSVRKVRGVKEVAGHLALPAAISLRDENVPVILGSIPDDATKQLVIEAHTYDMEKGRWVRSKESDAIVVGSDFAHAEVLSRKLALGDKVLVQNKTFEVVGILQRIGDPYADRAIFMSERAVREVLEVPDELFGILIIKMDQGVDAKAVQERVEHSLRRSHDLRKGQEDFEVQSPDDLLRVFNTIFNIVQAVLIGIALISLIVGGIGITNTMYTAVLERTREVGIMKAVGARTTDVFSIFLFESGMLGLLGGTVGVLFGMGVSKGIEFVAWQVLGSPLIRAQFPVSLIVSMLVFAFVVGVASGVTPAYRAAQLQPIEALRR